MMSLQLDTRQGLGYGYHCSRSPQCSSGMKDGIRSSWQYSWTPVGWGATTSIDVWATGIHSWSDSGTTAARHDSCYQMDPPFWSINRGMDALDCIPAGSTQSYAPLAVQRFQTSSISSDTKLLGCSSFLFPQTTTTQTKSTLR